MNADMILTLMIVVVTISFLIDLVSGVLNYLSFDKELPENVSDIYDEKEYKKSQLYKKENFRFNLFSSSLGFVLMILILKYGLLGELDSFLRTVSPENEITLSLLFFASIFIINDILTLPLQLYRVFIIEENFGFNKMSLWTFILDKFKSYIITIIFGLILLVPLLIFIMLYPSDFWIYFWIVVSLFVVFINMFYTSLIVPLFNKLRVLENGDLRDKLNSFAKKVDFSLSNIFIIDGSKRSSKANAYFSGFGKNKKIVLYDTLIKNHSVDELVAVLAHEIGHYKLKHIISNMIISIITTGIMLYIMSKFLFNSEISYALGGNISFRHLEIFAFFIIYSPINTILSILLNIKSRKNEYEADDFAVRSYKKKPLITALKRLSKDNLTNLTPHPLYEFINYSHPSLSKRLNSINNLK
tara:strand:- start:52 stop:1293 length:1242 start_codon:yes stop_codon:yes gene_type:complete